MYKHGWFLLIILMVLLNPGCEKPVELPDGLYAKLTTGKGTFIIELEYEKAPMTVANFVGLAEGTIKTSSSKQKYFYNGSVFNRVIPNFMIQAGAGASGTDPGYSFPDEFNPELKHNKPGTVSMVNNGPHTNGSQFMITYNETPWLDNTNPVFGYVVQGQSVVNAIKEGDKIGKVTILRMGTKAQAFQVSQEYFDSLVKAANQKIEEAKRNALLAEEEQEKALLLLKERQIDTSRLPAGLYALLKTSKGSILLQLEYKKAPLSTANFTGLAEGTLKATTRNVKNFYDGLTFHRVEKDFVIQGGCPLGDGTGNAGYTFPDEINPDLKHDKPGILAMANSGKDTNGSQFYITLKATPWLDGSYNVFGHVAEGMDVVQAIAAGDIIETVHILRIGNEAKKFIVNQQVFDKLKADVLRKKEQAGNTLRDESRKIIQSKYPKAKKTATGLMYIIDKAGTGTDMPLFGDDVTVHYTGTLLNGEVFDSSYNRNQPATFRIGQVIAGWNEALVMMPKGAKWTLIIPPELGYGASGTGPIPPDSYLIFEVELLDFKHN